MTEESSSNIFSHQKRKASSTSVSLYDSDDEETDATATKRLLLEESRQIAREEASLKNADGKDNGEREAKNSAKGAKGAGVKSSLLRSVCAARKGEREEMQDRHVLVDSFGPMLGGSLLQSGEGEGGRCGFYALFDGHGGAAAADYCAEHFAQSFVAVVKKYVSQNSTQAAFERSIKKIFIETYKAVDDEFLLKARKIKPVLKDGTTATTIFVLGNAIYSANIGDSTAVVCRYKSEKEEAIPLQITVEHNPIAFSERMRIQKAGGTVRVMGILEVSRSIGDGQMKAHGVICTPDIKKLTITEDDLFLIVACDGLWKVLSPEEAVTFVVQRYRSGQSKDCAQGVWSQIADELNAEAVKRGCGDNVTVVLVVLAPDVGMQKCSS